MTWEVPREGLRPRRSTEAARGSRSPGLGIACGRDHSRSVPCACGAASLGRRKHDGSNGHHGFSYSDDTPAATRANIVSEAIDGDTVVITLSSDPGAATNKKIRYAYDGQVGAAGGPTTGPRGNLCDSDATVSASGGAPLVNWALAFNDDIPLRPICPEVIRLHFRPRGEGGGEYRFRTTCTLQGWWAVRHHDR